MIGALALALALAAGPEGGPCSSGGVLAPGLGTAGDDMLRSAAVLGAPELAPGIVRRGGNQVRCGDASPLPWALPRPAEGAEGTPAFRAVSPRLVTAFATASPAGGNDGLLWAGRGVSGLVTGGVEVRWRAISAAFAPELTASANEPFETVPAAAPLPPLANPYYGAAIDLPQRFGTDPFADWAPGQSYLRADAWNVGLGISTENLWFGPGIRNSLTLSNAGPGFPHVFVGTSRPGDVRIGKAEAFAFWGRLSRSDEFPDQSRPLVSGLVIGFAPAFEPGLSVGLARLFVQTWDPSWGTLLAPLQPFSKRSLPGDNPDDNQLVSLFGRWDFPGSGFSMHGEWGREDHEWDVDDAIKEPDHSQAYLLGLEKVWRRGARRVRLQAELTHLQEQRPLDNARGVPVWYTHGENLSHTHRGQLLGAWIGPGADSQTVAVDVFSAGGRVGAFVERVRRNDAHYWAVIEPAQSSREHDVDFGGGLRGVLLRRGLEVTWEGALSKRWNRDWVETGWNGRVSLGVAVPLTRPAAP